jgi:CRP-like cAMP-binding protein
MQQQLQKINTCIANLNPQAKQALHNITVQKTYKKGSFLLQQDAVCQNSFLIETGVARKFYLNNGKEITTELYFTNDLAVAFNSYCLQQPSAEFIQAVTNVTTNQINYTAFTNAKSQHPQLLQLDLLLTEHYALWLEERLFELNTLNASKRYKKLLINQPHIIQQVPLTFIASYLSISLETLSRIRAKM